MIGLAFSGGKDSWACLYLNLHRIKDITVIWVNTGKNYPIALEMIEKAKALCPNFIEVESDREGQNAARGLPSDIVPINWTSGKHILVQSYLGCCYENISKPINDKINELGITTLISGQRLDETHKSQYTHGTVLNGIELDFPLENWTKHEVIDYLKTKMDIPAHFELNHTSLDCYDCTAYLSETQDRFEWAKQNYPELHEINMNRIEQLKIATANDIAALWNMKG